MRNVYQSRWQPPLYFSRLPDGWSVMPARDSSLLAIGTALNACQIVAGPRLETHPGLGTIPGLRPAVHAPFYRFSRHNPRNRKISSPRLYFTLSGSSLL